MLRATVAASRRQPDNHALVARTTDRLALDSCSFVRFVQFLTPPSGGPQFLSVLSLAKSARATVGFLPDSAFADRANLGNLLLCLDDDGQLLGYALYDLPRNEIRLGQLVVAKEARGQGVARLLVDQIQSKHPTRRGIFLRCRNDFPATEMWPRIGFSALDERAGRSFDGKPLTLWWRDFGQANLFTLQAETDSRPVAVLDACVFFDLVEAGPTRVSRELRSDWIDEHARLAVTTHLFEEIRRGSDAKRRARERAAARPFELPNAGESDWRERLSDLRARHPAAPAKDEDDLTHLAHAIAIGAGWMVTSDRRFRRRYAKSAVAMGNVKLISPAGLVKEADELARRDLYRPKDLAGTSVTRREVDASALAGLAERFVNHPRGEKIRELQAQLEDAAARTSQVRLQLLEVDADPRGLLGFELKNGALSVLFARVSRGVGDTTIARHLLATLRDEAVDANLQRVRVHDTNASSTVVLSYPDEGFFVEDDQSASAYPIRGIGELSELNKHLVKLKATTRATPDSASEEDATEAEVAFAPFRVLGAGLPTFIVPIKPAWATELFDSRLAEGQLFSREWTLGLRRQLVYYRSRHAAGGIRAPARILWYVSDRRSPGGTEVRAVSQLREVVVAPADHLHNRFERLGTYSLEQIQSRADAQGRAMALRFSHTREFARSVGLDDLRRILTGDPKSRSVVLRSPKLIDEHTFVEIMRRGFPDDP